jgi:hypothetical protein
LFSARSVAVIWTEPAGVSWPGVGIMTQSGSQSPLAGTAAAKGQVCPHRTRAQVAKDIALLLAAPFVTLLYVTLFPFIGIAMLVRTRRGRKEAG